MGDAGIGKSRLIHEFLALPVSEPGHAIECGAIELDAMAGLRNIKKLLRSFLDI